MKKLLVIGITWPPETFIERKLKGLAQCGYEITAFGPALRNKSIEGIRISKQFTFTRWFEYFLALGWAFRVLVTKPSRFFQYWHRSKQASISLKGTLRFFLQTLPLSMQDADVVHYEWNSAAATYLPFYDVFGCAIAVSCRGSQVQIAPYNPKRQDFVQRLRISLGKAHAIHCVSAAMRDEVIRLGAAPEKIHIIRPAVDPTAFKPTSSRRLQQLTQIISVGSLIWRKGYPYALSAIRILLDRGIDVQYEIIGDGPAKQEILYTIHDLELEDNVVLAGKLLPQAVVERLQSSDIFLLTSWSEGISNAVLEAMSCALPVVTTDCGGMREAVEDRVEGFVVPLQAPVVVADTLEKLVRNPSLRQSMGQHGRQRVLEEFTLDQQIEDFFQLYQSINTR